MSFICCCDKFTTTGGDILDIPHDPIILVSYVNTKLRDQFATLEEFCQTYEVNEDELRSTLSTIDYQYDETTNQFV
jgi:hypothetical protein